jgi:hypothetical protein
LLGSTVLQSTSRTRPTRGSSLAARGRSLKYIFDDEDTLDILLDTRSVLDVTGADALAKQQNHAAIAEHSGIKA